MRDLILKHIDQFVEMDPSQTCKICKQWFDNKHLQIVKALKDANDLTYKYINTVLNQNEKEVIQLYNSSLIEGQKVFGPENEYHELMMRMLTILCKERKQRSKVIEYVSRSYFPIDECLAICDKYQATDACAVLYKRKGDY
jgi:hypothetical protein